MNQVKQMDFPTANRPLPYRGSKLLEIFKVRRKNHRSDSCTVQKTAEDENQTTEGLFLSDLWFACFFLEAEGVRLLYFVTLS